MQHIIFLVALIFSRFFSFAILRIFLRDANEEWPNPQ